MTAVADLTRRLQRLIDTDESSFSAMATNVGLNPRKDFRNADMSGADLRGQDLRGFDFSGADFNGAKIHGAHFKPKLSWLQRQSAQRSGRATGCFIGLQLEEASSELSAALSPAVLTSPEIDQSLQRVGREREAHYGTREVFLADGRPTVSRMTARPFRAADSLIKSSRSGLILFQPSTDFDFDILTVVQRRFERAGKRHVTFVFPSFMEGDAGRRLFEVRAERAFHRPYDTVIFEKGSGRPAALRAAQDSNSRYLQHVVDWIKISDQVEQVASIKGRGTSLSSDRPLEFVSGLKAFDRSLINSLRGVVSRSDNVFYVESGHRRHLFISKAVAAATDLESVCQFLSAVGRPVTISAFEDPGGLEDRFFLLAAPEKSALWLLARP